MKRVGGRWRNMAVSNAFRGWLVDYTFSKAGNLLKRSALATRLGRGFTRFKEAYSASLVRYQHGKFAEAAERVQKHSLYFMVTMWRRKAAAMIVHQALQEQSDQHAATAALLKLHRRYDKESPMHFV